MRAFIDTSSLFKKYHFEEGTRNLFDILKNVSEIVVSPITHLEMTNTAYGFYHEKKITKKELEILCRAINQDFQYFKQIPWSNDLENLCFHWMNHHHIKTLDIIQLTSAQHSKCQQFITSDKNQYKVAKKELNEVIFI